MARWTWPARGGARGMEEARMDTELVKGTVAPIILKLLSERPMYGYEIIKQVNERTNNALAWKEGTLYPWLHRLENDGLIAGDWREAETGRPRKYYTLRRRGLAALRGKRAEWGVFAAAVTSLLREGARA